MIEISNEFKELYNRKNIPKKYNIYFPELSLTITNNQIVNDSFSLDENLCSDEDIVFGSCEASKVKFTLADIQADIKGKTFTLTQVVNNTYSLPLGIYVVDSVTRQDNLRFKEVIAYDIITKSDVDVADWYNSLTFPLPLAVFRSSLLSHLGIEEETKVLPNDSMTVTKTIEPSQISGRDVLKACEEINGCFGHINRYGKFAHVVLEPSYGLYPTVTLLPADDLFPVSENDSTYFQQSSAASQISTAMCESVRFEEFTVKEIDKLQIRQEEGDIGAIVGTGTNAYVIEGNILVYGKSAEELNTIAVNAFGNMQKRPYRPYQSNNVGLPYIEVGDTIAFNLNDPVAGYVFKRTLTGIQALRDAFTAEGNEEREQNFSVNKEIIQLQGKTNVIKRTVEELSVTLTDTAAGLQNQITITAGQLQTQITDNYNSLSSSITQTAGQLQTQITDNENNLQSQITQQAGQIELKVDSDGVIAAINLSPETAKIQAPNISLEGLVTVGEYVQITMDGKLKAVDGEFTGKITSNSAEITGGSFKVTALNQNDSRIVLTYNSYSSSLSPYGLVINGSSSTQYASLNPGELFIGNPASVLHSVDITSEGIQTPSCFVNGSTVITYATRNDYYYDSNHINPIYTGSGNVGLNGVNIASVNWVNGNFQPLSSSDFRLKCDFRSLDELPDELYMALKPWQYRFKINSFGNGVFFGLFAQQIESAFEKFGLNALDYNLVEIVDKRKFTDEGQYVSDGKVHRVNYENFHAWTLRMVQKIYHKVFGV